MSETSAPDMSKIIPDWVTEERFAELLRKNVENFEKINKFKAYPALKPGENYNTIMLRVEIEFQLKDGSVENVSYVLKVAHNNEQMRQLLALGLFFLPENTMYSEVIPELEQMYNEAGVQITFAPKYYKFPSDPNDYYVLLEDLKPRNFKNVNRVECLDLEHTKASLKKMAQLHAASACRVAQKGPLPQILMDGLFNDFAKPIWMSMMTPAKMAFLNNLKLYKNAEKYQEKLGALFDTTVDQVFDLQKYNPDEFNVLNHGDHWSNNILFKYAEDGSIEETYYVDFQMSKFGSPAIDLLYFIISSVRIDIKLKQFDYFIRYYYENLIENLTLLKYPKKLPSLRQLHIDIHKSGFWAFITAITTLPGSLLDPTDLASTDNFVATDEAGMNFKNALYSNDRYVTYINEILPWIYDRGWLEAP